ncbi:prepilin-type N-terminal cleavage/methylation domain-containing protein [Aliagarivorans taiwanensis]|uniref:prepilin-type N-terminal cleavage/methylation domain-containing protein n=1 Tax=Aliagarivorans taiwanensis TaxID=561966 RepID=UPI000A017E90
MQGRIQGFTLIELVSVIAILAMLYPNNLKMLVQRAFPVPQARHCFADLVV